MHCITFALWQCVMHFRCVVTLLLCCVLVSFGLGWAHDAFKFAYHMLIHFLEYVPSILYIVIFCCYFSDSLSLSLSLSLSYVSLLLWHLNANLLSPKTFCVLGHLFPLTLLHLLFDSMMRMPERTSRRTFVDKAFIWNATSFCQTFLTLTYPLSFTVGVGSHFVAS